MDVQLSAFETKNIPGWNCRKRLIRKLNQIVDKINDYFLCHFATLSLCHFTTLSLCHFVTLSLWSLCHLVTLSLCHFGHFGHFVTLVTLSLCHFITLSLCHFVTLSLRSLCHFVTLPFCHFVTLSLVRLIGIIKVIRKLNIAKLWYLEQSRIILISDKQVLRKFRKLINQLKRGVFQLRGLINKHSVRKLIIQWMTISSWNFKRSWMVKPKAFSHDIQVGILLFNEENLIAWTDSRKSESREQFEGTI